MFKLFRVINISPSYLRISKDKNEKRDRNSQHNEIIPWQTSTFLTSYSLQTHTRIEKHKFSFIVHIASPPVGLLLFSFSR